MKFEKYLNEENKKTWLDAAKWVVKNSQAVYINQKTYDFNEDKPKNSKGYVLLDGFTANTMIQIHNALSPKAKKKFEDMSLIQAVDITWKIAK